MKFKFQLVNTPEDLTADLIRENRIDKYPDYTWITAWNWIMNQEFIAAWITRFQPKEKFEVLIFLSPNLSLRVINISIIAPTITAFAFDFLVLPIWKRRNEAARFRSLQIENAQFIEERRIYALNAVELMRESVSKKTEAEEVTNGRLSFKYYLYGKLTTSKLVQSPLLSP